MNDRIREAKAQTDELLKQHEAVSKEVERHELNLAKKAARWRRVFPVLARQLTAKGTPYDAKVAVAWVHPRKRLFSTKTTYRTQVWEKGWSICSSGEGGANEDLVLIPSGDVFYQGSHPNVNDLSPGVTVPLESAESMISEDQMAQFCAWRSLAWPE